MFIPDYAGSEQSDAAPAYLSRRGFVGAVSGSFVLALTIKSHISVAAESKGDTGDKAAQQAQPALFIAIQPDGAVRITCHRSEMGQQVWTSMAQIIADELEADWSRVEIVQAQGDARYGDQNTDGSRSVRYNFERLRHAGGAMRAMLEAAAASRWNVPIDQCNAANGAVLHATTGQRVEFGELATAAAKQPVPTLGSIPLKKPADWRFIGKAIPSLTVPMITRGEGTFGIDVQLPEMLHAVIARPPQLYASVASVDDGATLKVPGVVRTVRLDSPQAPPGFKALGGVAVIGRDTWSCIQGRKALKLTWSTGPNDDYNSAAFEKKLRQTANEAGIVRRNRGDVKQALAGAETHISADYYVPHLSQAPMEPPAAAARWSDGKVECWGCVQAPQAARKTVADVCGIKESDVTINVTLLGGAFGRKSKPDFFVEAALLARAVDKPVKVTWTREDDLQHGYYHSVSAQHLEGGLDKNGACSAFLHRTVFPPILSTFEAGLEQPSWGELRLGASDNPFVVPNLRLETGDAPAKVRIGWLRSVANIYHAFAIQSFAAELAAVARRDPKDYLLDLIGPPRLIDPTQEGVKEYDNYGSSMDEYPIDTARMRNVIEVVATMARWGRSLRQGHGLGIAMHRSFVSYVATVVEVAVSEEGRLTIPAVWTAIDAGTVINRRHVEAQVEGGTLYGLSNALYGEITAENGAIVQTNFPHFRLMRIDEAPHEFSVHIVNSDAPPGGVGEPPTPPAAPALANAIFAATGQRIRRLPIFGAAERDNVLHFAVSNAEA